MHHFFMDLFLENIDSVDVDKILWDYSVFK